MKNIDQALLALLDLVFALDQKGRFLYIGALTARVFGSDRDRLIGEPLAHTALPAATVQQLLHDYQLIFASERPTSGEIRLPVFYQDATKDYEYTFSPVRGPRGTVEAAVFIAKDITERKRAEVALQESEAKYRALFEAASDIILILDASTYRVLNANWAAARKLGYTRRELLDLSIQAIAAPFEPQRQAQMVQRLEMDGEIIYEHHYRRKNGATFPVEINAQLIEYEEQLAIQSFVRDISERKQAEEALRQQQRQIESIAASFPGVIYREVLHPDGSVTLPYVSKGITQFSGLSPEDLMATPERFVEAVLESDRPAFEAQLQYGRRTLQPLDAEYRTLGPTGEVCWAREIARFYQTSTGEVVTDGVILDVTERREAQLALERQLGQERLLRQVIEQIHQSFDLPTILQTTANSILTHLQAERILISHFNPDWSSDILAQAVRHKDLRLQTPSLYPGPCVTEGYIEYYRQGEVEIASDIYDSNLSADFREYLAQFQVRSHLVVPILVRSPDSASEGGLGEATLWGLMIAHQCSQARQWQIDEINLFKQLSTQLGIAIYQSELYQNLQNQLQERTRAEAAVRSLNAELEHRVQERTLALQAINQDLEQEIQERWQVETALRASEQRYATLTALAPVGIFHTDAAGHCRYVNSRCCEILGFSEAEALNQPWEARLHPDDRQQVIAAWQRATQTRTAYQVECRVVHTDGSLVWIIAQGQPELNDAGAIVGFVSTVTDISNRKQAERNLATSEERLRTLVDALPLGIWMCDADDRIILQNQEDIDRYGNILGDRLEETSFSPEQIARHQEIKRTCPMGESVQYEAIEYLQGEERTLLRVTGKVPDFSGGIGMFGAAIDISARKRSEEKFRALFQHLGIGVAILEPPRYTLESTNPALQAMLGYGAAELATMTCADLSHPDDWATEVRLLEECLDGRRDVYQVEKRCLRQDQREIWVNLTFSVVRNGSGRCKLGVCAVEDITPQKQLEQSLRDSQAALEDVLDHVDASIVRFCIFDNGSMRTEFVSAGCETVFGYRPEELTGDLDLWRSRVIPEDLDTVVRPSRQRVLETGYDAISYRFRHRDGQIRHIHVRSVAHRDDRQRCWFITAIESTRPSIRS